ncbi:sugar ABC transporter permease [Labrys miyagiensis]|uniref:Sugar ABC transporter permease n=1 Tax=Labrys miyagiensis TaxID=346912 RepID=A0ABQ6CVY2_9HYPH|nr:sugar ABC transporter permease [Labrys miyagiensis]GLS22401.1 sugar ABC transporter permease [Labrys miyagiensis]
MRLGPRSVAFAFVAPSIICLACVIGYPLVQAIATSLYRWNLISGNQRWAGINNFIDILQNPDTVQVAVTTSIYTGLAVAIEFVAGYALALVIRAGMSRRLRGFPMFRVILCVPLFIAPLIWAFYFRSIYGPNFGAFNELLAWFGLPGVPWVNDPNLAIYSLVVADAWQWTPFMFAIILAGMQTVPEEVLEAARVDGASTFQILYLVELPILKPILLIALLLRMIDALKNIDLIIVITQGGPGTSTEILNYYAYRTSFLDFQVGRGAALSLIVFAVIMALVLLLLTALRSPDKEVQG